MMVFILRITVDWMRILQQYSYTRGYVWNQYIPLDVQHVLGRPAADPVQYMQLWPWHYIMQARHCPDSCQLMYSMDCCSTQLSSPYTWKRTSMRMKILAHRIHGTSYRPRFQDLQLQLRCQELHPRPPWVHPDLQWWRALQGWICEVHGWILLQFFYNGFWLHVSNSAWIHPSDTILATRCLYINTALRFDRCTGFSKAKFCTDDWCHTWFNTVQLYNDSFNVYEVHVAVEAGC